MLITRRHLLDQVPGRGQISPYHPFRSSSSPLGPLHQPGAHADGSIADRYSQLCRSRKVDDRSARVRRLSHCFGWLQSRKATSSSRPRLVRQVRPRCRLGRKRPARARSYFRPIRLSQRVRHTHQHFQASFCSTLALTRQGFPFLNPAQLASHCHLLPPASSLHC